ncbi:SRPBCC family protein [Pseudonocardia sp. T1-2H]|uniref:SRPBCC family protein n=1 Tax=Pseudonocardia sp. T1-2H TaxID=3128899 RepID=UPI0031010E67
MIEVSRVIPTDPDRVFAVLADGWSYPLWVVGATHMRSVDPDWPAVGSKLHHSVGIWPLQIEDNTEVLAVDPGRMLELRARAWPAGTARVRLTLDPVPEGTLVTMAERSESGPARLVPWPIESSLLKLRNTESLQRLSDLVMHRGPVK